MTEKETQENNIMPSSRQKWLCMTAVGLSTLMAMLDMSIINVSLPTLVKELNTTFPMIQWVILGYALTLTTLMLGVARLGDMFPKKPLFAVGVTIFTIASILCGLSPDVVWLIGFRVIQGVGSVMAQALGPAIITEVFPPSERGKGMGIIGSIVAIGVALGPPLGGIIISTLGWHWIFFVNVPVGIFALFIIMKFMPSLPVHMKNQTFDKPGAAVLFITLACFAMGMTMGQDSDFGNMSVRLLLLFSLAGFISFILIEKKTDQPMVELSLFRNLLFSTSLSTLFLHVMLSSGFILLPFFLQLVKGYPTQYIGLMMMVTPMIMAFSAPFAGWLSDHFGTHRITILGLSADLLGCLLLATLHKDVTVVGYLLRMAPFGIGLGLFNSSNNSAIMGSVPPHRVGVASGLMSLSRSIGQMTWIPVMGAIFMYIALSSASLESSINIVDLPPQALVAGINGAYRIVTIVMFTTIVLSILLIFVEKRNKVRKEITDKIYL